MKNNMMETTKTPNNNQNLIIEMFELFAAQTMEARQESLKAFDRMVSENPPESKKLFAKIRSHLAGLAKSKRMTKRSVKQSVRKGRD